MLKLPEIIQGGMGLGVSNWKLASAVAQCGQMGVVSCTAIDEIMVRLLQMGDLTGNIRRAMSKFPIQKMIQPILDKYFIPGGKEESEPFKITEPPEECISENAEELLIVSNFVEVFLAKENHDGIIGVNYLEKVQLPTLPSLFGVILAGVNCILMGAGIPIAIPGIIDKLSQWKSAQLKLNVSGDSADNEHIISFDPSKYRDMCDVELKRPDFLGIVSSDIIAKTLIRKSTGTVDGFIVENHHAGGHNAPPRRNRGSVSPGFSVKDEPDLEKIKALGKPFWLAGGYCSPEFYKKALELGASGVQMGTPFAFCKESGIDVEIKNKVIEEAVEQEVGVKTDFSASPTGYPFKLVDHTKSLTNPLLYEERKRVCDLGYLRQLYCKSDGSIGYRCPAEQKSSFLFKGGSVESTVDKKCLCNGLLATIGLGQVRADYIEKPILTGGEDFLSIKNIVDENSSEYSAKDVIEHVIGKTSDA